MADPEELLQQLCRDLRLLWTEAGGPDIRTLAVRVGLGKSQVSAVLNGKVRRPPDWDVIRNLIGGISEYAWQHDRRAGLSVRTNVDEYWRPRYAVLEHAFRQVPRRRSSPGDGQAPAVAATTRAVPQQLLAAVTSFAGRSDELATLTELLGSHADPCGTVVISAIGGTAGVGKTALAMHWAHQVRERFPDGQLYADLRGFASAGTFAEPATVIRGFLHALGVPPQRFPAELDALTALYRSELAGRRMLILLDNARDSGQVEPLLPGTPGCLVLVTSRNHLSGLVTSHGAHAITLDLFSTIEARELLAHRLGVARVMAEPEAVEDIISGCARLPLALSIVAARAANRPHLPLSTLAGELHGASDRLKALTTDDPNTDVRAVFSWSYQALTADAARLFRLLGLHPGPEFTTAAAASLAALDPSRVPVLLDELTQANLIIEHIPSRYSFHDLLRAYAVHLTDAHETDQERWSATGRVLDHYLHTAYAADTLLYPGRLVVSLPALQPGVIPERITDNERALAWFRAEHAVLLATVDRAAADGFDTHAWLLPWTMLTFLQRRGHWHHLMAIQRVAVAAAHRLNDPIAQARTQRLLAAAYARLGRFDDAHAEAQCVLDLAASLEDPAERAASHTCLGYVWHWQGRYAKALDHVQCALDLYRSVGDRGGQAESLNAVGWEYAQLGKYRQALDNCQQALGMFQELGNRYGQAQAWDSLGYAHYHLNHLDQAISCYREASSLFSDFGDRYWEATTLTRLGDTYSLIGDDLAADKAWRRALVILSQLNHPDADKLCAKLAGGDVRSGDAPHRHDHLTPVGDATLSVLTGPVLGGED